MYELFDENKIYTLPNGNQFMGSELKSSGSYPMLSIADCAVNLSGGVLGSFCTVESLAEKYAIDISTDNDTIISMANNFAIYEKRKSLQETLTDSDILKAVKISALSFTDEQAVQVPSLYDEYQTDYAYSIGDRFVYNGDLYKVNQAHTSASQWVPGVSGTESLYTKIVINDDGYNTWAQPTGAHDAYNTGDIVEYKGVLYKSLVDGNVYAPDVYPAGWELYTES